MVDVLEGYRRLTGIAPIDGQGVRCKYIQVGRQLRLHFTVDIAPFFDVFRLRYARPLLFRCYSISFEGYQSYVKHVKCAEVTTA